ncbi:putative isomerase YbhE [Schizopora paradoxa]|uniref:Putative isomerase YbhE n=1 Tax=Schizopora paradoxa TaxID=27342 RepID=A0A0H2QYW9_9AGAM|nr:putative isomerase YbhE [Schizopora paradoxa]
MAYRFLVASYTNEIVTLEFKPPSSGSAELSIVSSQEVGFHPSWITKSLADPAVYYTGLEQEDGRLLSLECDSSTGQVKIIGDVSSGGHSPCSILVVDNEVLVGNYMAGTVAVYAPDGKGRLEPAQSILKFSGTGPNPDRQEGSHPHQAYAVDRGDHKEVLIPDLGADHIWRLKKNVSGVWEVAGSVSFDQNLGGGPRHVVLYENILYTLLELTSQLTAHTLPPLSSDAQPLKLLACSSTLLHPPASAPVAMLAAELLLAPPSASFPDAYLYASNRNDPHPEGDTIAIFKPYSSADPSLKLIAEVRTGLAHLRGMIFFGPDDRFLIAGGALGGGVKVFERIERGASLKEIALLPVSMGDLKPTGFALL